MALVLTSDPYDIAFSKNPIKFKFANTYHKMLLEIYVQDPVQTSNYNLITTLDSLLDSPEFDIWEYLDNELTYEFPTISQNSIINNTQCVRMYKLTAKAYDDSNTLQQTLQVDNSANNYIVMKGGLSYELYSTTSFFSNYISTNKGFLTWNNEANIHIDQKFYLPFLKYSTDSHRVWCRIYYTDGTSETKQKTDFLGTQWNLFQIAAGWEALKSYFGIVHDLIPYKYEFSIRKATDGTYLSEVFTVNISSEVKRYAKTFMYYNSLCGLEVLYATGSIVENLDISTTKTNVISDDNYLIESENYALSKTNFEVAAGYILKASKQALKDFVHSTDIIEQKAINVSIVIKKRSISISEDDNLHNFKFKYSYNYQDRVASPSELRTLTTPLPQLEIDTDNHYILIDSHHRLIL